MGSGAPRPPGATCQGPAVTGESLGGGAQNAPLDMSYAVTVLFGGDAL